MNELAFLLNQLGSGNSGWVFLEPYEKGYLIELLIYSSNNKNYGCIPNEDEKIRQILNIPPPFYNILEEENDPIKYYFKGFNSHNITQGMIESLKTIWKNEITNTDKINSRFSYEQWINFFWENKWKNNILKDWVIVDDKLIKKYSNLKNFKGFYWNETAYNISINNLENNKKIIVKRKNNSKINLPDILNNNNIFSADNLGIDGIVFLNNDIKNLLDFSQTLKCWREPATELQKSNIWDLGVSLLSGNKDFNKSKAKSIIAKQVKIHGNALVSKVIGEMAYKNNISDPIPLFLSILKRESSGTPEQIKARSRRISNNI